MRRMKDGCHKIGVIGVDAGLCWIGDPCYILHKDKVGLEGSSDRFPEEELGKDWKGFYAKLDRHGNALSWQFNYAGGHPGLGVCVTTGYGDGQYPVYAEIRNGRVVSVTVKFDEDDDEEARYDDARR